MERWKKRAVELLGALSLSGESSPSVIPYYPQKTAVSEPEMRSLPRATPESVGLSSVRLMDMLAELESERRANIHNVMVIKRGAVICEASAPGYDARLWHLSHSMSKTLTGMAIGLLVDDGVLSVSERVVDIFPGQKYSDPRFSELTVEQLLAMRSGVTFAELGVVTEDKWTEAFFSSEMHSSPGEKFAYNSMNSYILGKIAVKKSGVSLTELVTKRILSPLGIKKFLWECGPEGIEKGGFGVYLSAESWAKLGIMMLSGGVYAGRRILSHKWVSASVTTSSVSPESSGDFNYGYHLWVHRECDEFLFNGMLGQNVWVCPSNDTVVVINAGNSELFQQSPALYIVRKYLAGDIDDEIRFRNVRLLRAAEKRFFESRRYARPLSAKKGIFYFLGIKNPHPYSPAWNALLGRYLMRKNNDSLLPIFVRCMQNNLAAGIKLIEFSREGERLYMSVTEGDAVYKLEIGLFGFSDSVLDFNGELYRVRASGEAAYGFDGKPVFKIELAYPELPNSRFIELSAVPGEGFLMKLYESPDNRIAESFIETLHVTNPRLAFAKQLLERRLGADYLKNKLGAIFSPSLLLVDERAELREDILAREESSAEAENKTVKNIFALISRFIREDPVPDEASDIGEESDKQGFFGGLIERIKRLAKKSNG